MGFCGWFLVYNGFWCSVFLCMGIGFCRAAVQGILASKHTTSQASVTCTVHDIQHEQ